MDMYRLLTFCATAVSLLLTATPALAAGQEILNRIQLPPGFRIEYFSNNVPGARSLALGEAGTVFVGTRGEGKVYALPDRDHDRRADEVIILAQGLHSPNGVAVLDGDLYVAEIDRVLRYRGVEDRLTDPGAPEAVTDQLPNDEAHGWKFIAFGPDKRLYVPVGAPCNVCAPPPPYASLLRLESNGTLQIFASGIRNTVGFDWHPVTHELWFTDNGRDYLGDDLPPDELDHAPRAGLNFGFPYVYGSNVPDPEFGARRPANIAFTPPAMELGPHVAALGMRFYTGSMFPPEYRNQIFIAEHGSWNRSRKIGYRVTVVRLNGSTPVSYDVFAQGWLQGETVSGRPVDVLVMDDGSLLVSDDHAGCIYRISYSQTPQGVR